jgi:predicted GIY-YIG superfamily endonuclease
VPWPRRAPAPPPSRPAPTMLEVYGARLLPDLSGWWVYALGASTDGRVWYVGITSSLKRRLDEHEHAHPDLWDPRLVYLVPADSEPQACIRQLTLIDYYQPERNTLGTTEVLRKRVASLDKPKGTWSKSLDRSQATA